MSSSFNFSYMLKEHSLGEYFEELSELLWPLFFFWIMVFVSGSEMVLVVRDGKGRVWNYESCPEPNPTQSRHLSIPDLTVDCTTFDVLRVFIECDDSVANVF